MRFEQAATRGALMTRRSPVPPSPAFEATARGVPFRDRIAVVVKAPDGTPEVTWTFVLDDMEPGVTRLLVRVRGGPGYRFHGLPRLLTKLVIRVVHFIMQRKQLLGIRRRAESMRADTLVPAGEEPCLRSHHTR
jgi:hypothetical protein